MDNRIKKCGSWGRVSLFILALLLSCEFGTGLGKDSAQSKVDNHYKKKYYFSKDWFTNNIPTWEETLGHLKGKPNIHYLEIGVYEGRSFIWMLENILTHPTAKATCIDIFSPGQFQKKFLSNLKIGGFLEKVTIIKGRSQIELRALPINSIDIVYIDGSHTAKNVLIDAVYSCQLLKTSGIMIFDDYLWRLDLPVESRPKIAIDSFIAVFSDYIEVIHHGYQLILKKVKKLHPCE